MASSTPKQGKIIIWLHNRPRKTSTSDPSGDLEPCEDRSIGSLSERPDALEGSGSAGQLRGSPKSFAKGSRSSKVASPSSDASRMPLGSRNPEIPKGKRCSSTHVRKCAVLTNQALSWPFGPEWEGVLLDVQNGRVSCQFRLGGPDMCHV